jgi:hypothetical protein
MLDYNTMNQIYIFFLQKDIKLCKKLKLNNQQKKHYSLSLSLSIYIYVCVCVCVCVCEKIISLAFKQDPYELCSLYITEVTTIFCGGIVSWRMVMGYSCTLSS